MADAAGRPAEVEPDRRRSREPDESRAAVEAELRRAGSRRFGPGARKLFAAPTYTRLGQGRGNGMQVDA